MQTRKKSVTVKSGYRLKVEKTNYECAYAERLRESEINFVFCERVLYVCTAPEQKTKSAKDGKDSMSLPSFQSLRVQQVAPTSLYTREANRFIYIIWRGLAALSTVYLSSRKYERPSDAGGWSSLFFLTLTITRTIIVTM